jgi:hypothetical protein
MCKAVIIDSESLGGGEEAISDLFVEDCFKQYGQDIAAAQGWWRWKCEMCADLEDGKLVSDRTEELVKIRMRQHLIALHGKEQEAFRLALFKKKNWNNLPAHLMEFVASPVGWEPVYPDRAKYFQHVVIEALRTRTFAPELCSFHKISVREPSDDPNSVYELVKQNCMFSAAYDDTKLSAAEADKCVARLKQVLGDNVQSWNGIGFAFTSTFSCEMVFLSDEYTILIHIDDED